MQSPAEGAPRQPLKRAKERPLHNPEKKMKLKSRLMLCTAAFALSSTIAQAAIDPNALASTYLADDYSYVEVKTGPTQTKVEAVKGSLVVEVVYDNVTGAILKSETGAVEDDYVGRVGIEIETVDEDFEDEDDIEDDLE
ncbi:MAG: hypothetical protein B7Y02_11655, partial [Rhodobacterales bacterium 17-64-5]